MVSSGAERLGEVPDSVCCGYTRVQGITRGNVPVLLHSFTFLEIVMSATQVARATPFHAAAVQRSPLTRLSMDLAAARWEKHQASLGNTVSTETRAPQVPALFQARR